MTKEADTMFGLRVLTLLYYSLYDSAAQDGQLCLWPANGPYLRPSHVSNTVRSLPVNEWTQLIHNDSLYKFKLASPLTKHICLSQRHLLLSFHEINGQWLREVVTIL